MRQILKGGGFIIDGYLLNSNGKIFYKVIGEGKPILFIHGGPGLTHDYFIPYLLELSNPNNKLIFFDQRGNGLSTSDLKSEYININQFTLDIENLREELRIDKMVIMGHSMGTFFAIDYANRFPNHVSKLILSNATPMDLGNLNKMNKNLIKKVNAYSNQLSDISDTLEFKNYDSNALKRYLTILNKHNFFNVDLVFKLFENVSITERFMKNFEFINSKILNEYLNLISDYNIDDISIPTLIIKSDYDFIPSESSTYLKNNIKNSKVKTIYNSGHYPFIEKTIEFIDIVNDFLKE